MTAPITCVIVDDEPLAIRLLRAHVAQISRLRLTGAFENPLEALTFLRREPPDLLLLDIQMPVLTGLEVAKILPATTAVIFTTAHREHAVESYELSALDYLVKPITFPRFYQAVNKYLQAPPVDADPPDDTRAFRYFNVNKKHVKVTLADVTHVESLKDYVRIHTREKSLVTKGSIGELARTLPPDFVRVHRSFIVNLRQVSAFTANDLEIGTLEIPIGAGYKEAVMERLRS